jgi:hypothetical protein
LLYYCFLGALAARVFLFLLFFGLARVAQLVEHFHGKEKVAGSIPAAGLSVKGRRKTFVFTLICNNSAQARRKF